MLSAVATPRKMGNTRGWATGSRKSGKKAGASWPAHSEALVVSSCRARPAKDQAGPSSRRRRTNQDRCAHRGQRRAGKPGTLTEAIRTSGWISSQSHGKSQWENRKAGSGGSGTKPRYLQGRIRHLLKYNSGVLVGPSWRQSDRPGVGWTTHLSLPETSLGFHC